MLIVLTGKTASGKDTIKDSLLQKFPHLKKVITTTSRPPRDGEANGGDYHFVTRAEFEKKIASGEFAEYVEYGGNLYGTYKVELKQALSQNTLWKIDPSMAGKAKQLFPDSITIYITVDTQVVLQRLKKRGLSEEEIAKRMQDDQKFWELYKDKYDYVIENIPSKLDQTIEQIVKIIDSHL